MTRAERKVYRKAKVGLGVTWRGPALPRVNYFTKPMAARAVGVSLSAVTDAIAKKRLDAVTHYSTTLISVDALARWMASRSIAAAKHKITPVVSAPGTV